MILGPAITSFLIAMSRVYVSLYGHEALLNARGLEIEVCIGYRV